MGSCVQREGRKRAKEIQLAVRMDEGIWLFEDVITQVVYFVSILQVLKIF